MPSMPRYRDPGIQGFIGIQGSKGIQRSVGIQGSVGASSVDGPPVERAWCWMVPAGASPLMEEQRKYVARLLGVLMSRCQGVQVSRCNLGEPGEPAWPPVCG
jgi:hypothetical protein